MDRKKLYFFCIHVIVPITLGTLIYIFFRNEDIIFKKWFNVPSFDNVIKKNVVYDVFLPDWIIYSLPDGLWVYSFSAVLYLIWGKNFRGIKIIISIPFTLLCFLETLQYLKIMAGTFDLMDIMVSLIMSVLLIINLKLYKNEK